MATNLEKQKLTKNWKSFYCVFNLLFIYLGLFENGKCALIICKQM